MVILTHIVFLVLSGTASATACKCESKAVNELLGNPAQAKIAVIGWVKSENESDILVESAWTKAPAKLKGSPPGPCALKLIPEKRYLVLATKTPEFLDKRGTGLTACEAVAKEVTAATSEMETLARNQTKTTNPSWLYCLENDECVTTMGPCGNQEPVNKKFSIEWTQWAFAAGRKLDCSKNAYTKDPPKVACQNNMCRVIATQ